MRVIAVALAALVAVSIVLELPLFVPVIAIAVALVISSVCRRFVKEIMTDERDRSIQEKATSLSYRIFTIASAAFALTAMMLRSQLPEWGSISAQTLAYAVCALLLLHQAGTRYYGRKL
jgi:uncharacterized membrane protein